MIKKRILGIALSAVLSMALMITSLPTALSFADEYDDYEEEYEEDVPEYDDPVPAPDPQDYNFLSVSPGNLSFGTQTKGSSSDSQRVSISNSGSQYHVVDCSLNDPDNAFIVETAIDNIIDPGGMIFWHVSYNPNAKEGYHSATLIVTGHGSDSYTESGYVNLSVEIVNPQPYITNVSVSPSQISATAGANIYFSANVSGGNGYSSDVEWSVSNQRDSSTYITGGGQLIIGKNETAEELFVTAVSKQDRNYSDVGVVDITREKYTVTTYANPSNGGTTAGGGTFSRGDDTTIYASNANGFSFDGWYLNGNKVSSNNEYRIKGIRENLNYEARFSQNQVYVKVKKNIDDAGKVTDSQNLKVGSNITLNATPNKGYKFDCWKENDKKVSESPSFQINNITTSRTFTACFSRNEYKVNLSAYPEKSGVIEGNGYFAKGKDVVIKATPVDGYEFVNWTENGVPFSTSKQVTISKISKDYNFVANFKKKEAKMYTMLSAVTSNDGVILPSGNTQVQQGASLTYTIAAKEGYRIANVAVDGKQVGAVSTYTFSNIKGDHQIAAAFVPIEKKPEPTAKPSTKPAATAKPTAKPQKDVTTTIVVPETKPQEVSDDPVYTEVDPEPIIIDEDLPDVGSDEEIQEMTQMGGALQNLNLTSEEALNKIISGDSRDIYEMALYLGDLKVTINNDYADNYQETMYSSYYNNVSVPNFSEVLDNLLTTEQKLSVAEGQSKYEINLNILKADNQMSVINKQLIQDMKPKDMAIGTYFDILLMQDYDGASSLISELPKGMTIVMNIPEEYKSSDREYSIIRMHMNKDGSMDLTELKDEDNDPNTVTFTTNKFSYYALGFRDPVNGINTLMQARTGNARANLLIILIMIVLVAIAITLSVYLIQYIRRPKRHRRR